MWLQFQHNFKIDYRTIHITQGKAYILLLSMIKETFLSQFIMKKQSKNNLLNYTIVRFADKRCCRMLYAQI